MYILYIQNVFVSINKNMQFDIFEHFIPITWCAGHMGAFLQNFLTQETSYPIPLSVPYGMLPNKEWMFIDAFDNFFGSPMNRYSDIYDSLSADYSGLELMSQAANEVFKHRYKTLTKTNEISFEVLKNNSSRYVKEHTYQAHLPNFYCHQIRWKTRKIHCRFTDEFSWIPYFLLKYKFKNPDNIRSSSFSKLDEILQKKLPNSYIMAMNYNLIDPNNKYIDFDIYNLVINKNLDQVYEIDPDFKFDTAKQKMLTLANTTTIEILESYGLDPAWKITNKTTFKEILEQAKF